MPVDDRVTARRAEAAAWIARIRSEERTAADERGFQSWLAEDPANREVFKTLMALWDASASPQASAGPNTTHTRLNRRLLLAAAALCIVAIGIGAYIGLESSRGQTLTTARGEQRSLVLADGSRVILDTATRLRLHFSRERRALELLTGQAHFDVAKDPARPFIVTAGDKQVIAVGTAFDVSRELGVTSVMLTEGKIVVRQDGAAHAFDQTLSPGDRLIFQPDTRVRQDRPNIAAATAWQTGQVVFDDVPLSEAVEHMNRYESKPIVIADPAVGSMHISGAYKSGNADAFVKSVSILLPVVATVDGTQWVLTKDPRRR